MKSTLIEVNYTCYKDIDPKDKVEREKIFKIASPQQIIEQIEKKGKAGKIWK